MLNPSTIAMDEEIAAEIARNKVTVRVLRDLIDTEKFLLDRYEREGDPIDCEKVGSMLRAVRVAREVCEVLSGNA